MSLFKTVFTLILLGVTLSAGYRDDPRVREIIAEYNQVETLSKNGTYRMIKRGGDYDGEVDIAYLYFENRTRTPRKLKLEGGTGDSAHDAEYYYRQDGTLFFSYLRSANVRGCKTEIRNYFDRSGRRIYRKEKIGSQCAAQVGYDEIVRDPISEFANH